LNKKNQLIYVYPSNSSFIQNDIDFLSKKYNVLVNTSSWSNKILLPKNLLSQFFFFLFEVRKTKHIVVSFGGYWSLIPTVFGKIFNIPVYIILNGTDCVSFPNYNYGSIRKSLLRYFIKKTYFFATKLLPVSETLIFDNYTYSDNCKYSNQGFKYHFPNLKTAYEICYNGFDFNKWVATKDYRRKPNSFITVASIKNDVTYFMKGIDRFIELATLFKNCSFTIVGISKEMLSTINNLPQNVNAFDFLNQEDLNKKYHESSFYLQLSINEGFGCSLCEAMLAGCIPIGSNVGIIAKIIGKSGFILEKNKIDLISQTLQKALNLTEKERAILSEISKKRIVENFSIKRREKHIIQILEPK